MPVYIIFIESGQWYLIVARVIFHPVSGVNQKACCHKWPVHEISEALVSYGIDIYFQLLCVVTIRAVSIGRVSTQLEQMQLHR